MKKGGFWASFYYMYNFLFKKVIQAIILILLE